MTRSLAFAAFVSTVWLANYLISSVGLVGVGFGLVAPAGVYVVGASFALRDLLHEVGGVRMVLAAIAVGAGLSSILSPTLAVASAVAFGLSELADLAVYTPLRERSRTGALVASNIVGAVVDSAVFLALAFGSLQFLPGQVLGKAWMTAMALPLVLVARRRRWVA